MRKYLSLKLAVCLLAFVAPAAQAAVFVSFEQAGYTGSWTRYGTLADAQAGTNALGSGAVPQRDLSLYISQGVPSIYGDTTVIMSLWYAPGSPSNQNFGFLQIYEDPETTAQSVEGYFTDPSMTTYQLNVAGKNATAASSVARFGEKTGGPASTTSGEFHTYDLQVTFGGLSGTYNPGTGLYESDGFAGSVTGSFTGIFENKGTDPTRHGFYAINLAVNNENWAVDNGHISPAGQAFFSSTVVPEPTSMLVLGSCLVGGFAWRKRFQRKA